MYPVQVLPWNSLYSTLESRLWSSISPVCISSTERLRSSNRFCYCKGDNRRSGFIQSIWRPKKRFTSQSYLFSISNGYLLNKFWEFKISLQKVVKHSEKFRDSFPVLFVQLIVGVMLVMTVNVAVSKSPSCKFGCSVKQNYLLI